MKTVTYRKVEYNQVRGSSCDKCYFFQLEPSDRPCGKRPLDKNSPNVLVFSGRIKLMLCSGGFLPSYPRNVPMRRK